MFNSYYANISPSQNVTVNTPSSIMGTIVKSHKDSVITCMKIGSNEFKELFGIKEQQVSYKIMKSYDNGYSSYEDITSSKAIVLQTMLANNDMIFVEYVLDYNSEEV